jgi:5-deoxy-glucuronate isomerase
MDVALLVMEEGDVFSFNEGEKELACLLLSGKAALEYPKEHALIERPNPFDHNPYCLHLSAGDSCTITARGHCEFYIQKTFNDKKFPAHLYASGEINTWQRGIQGECGGCIRRDVRTCFDYENAPYSNMVLGEVVNLPGKWSSYPPHDHPQPEVYFFYFEKPQGFGAGWVDGKIEELHHHGLALITRGTHPMVMAPGYACCYVWGIRHLPGNPWEKTRIDDPAHEWLNDPGAVFWNGGT